MKKWWLWFSQLFRRCRKSTKENKESETVSDTAKACPPAESDPTPKVDPPEPPMNRHARRVFERARRRHDKFVEPKGPLPFKQERKSKTKTEKPKPEVKPNLDSIDPPDDLIVGEWLEGDGENVLYEKSEFFGEFNFRDTILEQLDRYWVYLDRMRKHDRDAYEFYSQLGATLIPYAATGTSRDKPPPLEKINDIVEYKRRIYLTPEFIKNWPAFGCCVIGANPRDEKAETIKISGGYMSCPKFAYYRRVKRFPWTVQPVHGGKCYIFTLWWDRVQRVGRVHYKWGRPQEFPVHISDDGTKIRILKTRESRGKIRPWWDWRISHDYEEWAKQYGLDVQTHLTYLFCEIVRGIEHAGNAKLRIEVTRRDGLTAVFGLDPQRTSYFFQDRDIILNESGQKKRVFHTVQQHTRKDGTTVPTHFRGLREFTWANYHVRITVPGRDHFKLSEFNMPSEFHPRQTKDWITEGKLAKRLKTQIHKRFGRHVNGQ